MEKAMRPSFLEDVLASAGQAEMTDLKERILDVTQNISQLKLRVNDYMKNMYVDFDPLLKKDRSFLEQARRISGEMTSLYSRIEVQTKCDLANSTGELRNLHSSLKETSLMLSITEDLLKVDKALRDIEKAQKDGLYLDAAHHLNTFHDLLKNVPKDVTLLDIYKSVSIEYGHLHEDFCYKRIENISSLISWEESDGHDNTTFTNFKVVTSRFSELEQVAQALQLLDMLKPWIRRLRAFVLRSMLLPLIHYDAVVNVIDDEYHSAVEIEIKKNSAKPNYAVVFANLMKVFEFLHGELDIQFDNGSFMQLLGLEASDDFSENLINHCLRDTVPGSRAELDAFSEVQEKTADLYKYISGLGFLSEENTSILDYVRNVDTLCTNKACEMHLENARAIMKKDLQDMVQLGPEVPAESFVSIINSSRNETVNSSMITSGTMLKPGSELNSNLFQFPMCCVSKSVLSLMDLIKDVLQEACRNNEQSGVSLFNTARSVLELYMAVVPTYHAKFLSTIPQQVALFHNNCMYLAHRLLVLGFEVEPHLRSAVKSSTVLTFVDLVHCLRTQGTTTFLKHMQQQRKQILDAIKESGLATLGENSKLSSDAEKAVRQCLRQLELLQTVWEDVLPSNVYSKSIGVLINAFIEELLVRVVSVEDIPANTATQLSSLFSMVVERAPKLFKDEREIVLHVKRWQKFQELINILGANLKDIEERWADGKGPLAQEFTMDQVKQLIRALFQNTKRRAEVLSKIR